MLKLLIQIILDCLKTAGSADTLDGAIKLASKVNGFLVLRNRKQIDDVVKSNKDISLVMITYEELFLFYNRICELKKPVIFEQGVFLEVLNRLLTEVEVMYQENEILAERVLSFKNELINIIKDEKTETLTLIHPDPNIRTLYKEILDLRNINPNADPNS